MKDFRVDAIAQDEFDDAAVWYEAQRDGLGLEFIAEIDRVLARIAHHEAFATAPIALVEGGVVRRELVDRVSVHRGVRRDRGAAPGDHDPARQLELRALAIAALSDRRV